MSEAVFKRSNLKHYYQVSEPGTSIVTVANTVKPHYLIEEGSKSRYLVNLRVGETKMLEEALKILGQREECAFTEVAHCFMAGVLWENELIDLEQLPTKGESIIATFDEDDEGILRCVSLTLIPRKQLPKFDLEARNYTKVKLAGLLKELDI